MYFAIPGHVRGGPETCGGRAPLSCWRINQATRSILSATSRSNQLSNGGRAKRVLKWVVIIAALVFFFSVLRESLDPFGDQPYVEISHGDHVHYVPKDRDPKVSIGNFPTQRPEPHETITPEGRVVERE